jgi:MFS family permease
LCGHDVADPEHAGVSQSQPVSYLALLRVPGCALIYTSGAFARLPVAMLPLAFVLVVREAGGSYAEAGAVVAAYTTAVAVTQPLISRLIDRRGQRRVLLPRAFVFPALLLLEVWLIHTQAPLLITLVGAAAAGSTLPPVSSSLRVLLGVIVPSALRYRAYALDAVMAEAIWVASPLVVTLVVAIGDPAVAVAVAAASAGLGTLAFAATRASRSAPITEAHERGARVVTPPLRWVFCFSTLFAIAWGGLEVSMPIFAEQEGNRDLAGLLLGGVAAGSLVGGLLTGALSAWPPTRRMVIASAVYTTLLFTLLLGDSMVVMVALAFLVGVPLSTAIAAMFTLISEAASAGRETETFAWTTTTFAGGTAIGVQLSGLAGDVWGFSGAIAVALVAGSLTSAAAWVARRAFKTASPGTAIHVPPAYP